MTFDEWFNETYPKEKFGDMPGVLRMAFREVAERAWIASRENKVYGEY